MQCNKQGQASPRPIPRWRKQSVLATLLLLMPLAACGGGTTTNQNPVASFSMTPSSGVGPLKVSTDASASKDSDGSIAAYAWDWGDGSTGNGVKAEHTFTTRDTPYTVTLKVTDDKGGTATDTRQLTVSAPAANKPPIAVIKVSTQQGTAPLSVAADGSKSSDPDGSVASYSWDWGDGTTTTGASSSHVYKTTGSYTLKLTVTDDKGLTATDTAAITVGAVAANKAPTAVIKVTPEQGTAPLTISADGSGSSDPDGSVASYTWDWGDGFTATGVSNSHTYLSSGTYALKLTVTDDKGLTSSATKTITVGTAADTIPPTIVSMSPAAGARKQTADTVIKITFSEPMDPAPTEQAFKSQQPGLRSGEVNFTWNSTFTALTITPRNPLAYGDGAALAYNWAMQGAKDRAGNIMNAADGGFYVFGKQTEMFNSSRRNSGFVTERPDGTGTRLYTDTTFLAAGTYGRPNQVGQIRSLVSYVLSCPVGSICGTALTMPIGQNNADKVQGILKATLHLRNLTSTGDPLRKLQTTSSACFLNGDSQPGNFVISSAYYDSIDEGDYNRVGGLLHLCHLDSVPNQLDVDVTKGVLQDWNNRSAQGWQSQFIMHFANTSPDPENNVLFMDGPSGTNPPQLEVDFLVDP